MKIFAVVGPDYEHGREGIWSVPVGQETIPLIAKTEEGVADIVALARIYAKHGGLSFRVIEFTETADVTADWKGVML